MTNGAPVAGPETASGIRIGRVAIRNFRGIDEVQLDLEVGTTYLVGENNAGKTSILLALWSALGSRRPIDDDLRRLAPDSVADEVSVDVFIVPSDGEQFSTDLTRHLINVQRDPLTGSAVVGIRSVFKPSREGSVLSTRRSFLQPVGDEWIPVGAPMLPPPLMDRLEAHLLPASRDLVSDVGNRTSMWGRVLADLQINRNPVDGESREQLEHALVDIARRVRQASPVLSALEEDLAGIADSQASVGRVELQALPQRLEELARTAEVVLHQASEPDLPLRLHGLGSRSLATLFVFQTLARFRVGADRGFRPHLVTLLEEPEAHLHPQAIVALRTSLARLPGQRVVSTHSSQLIADADPRSVRLIRRSAGSIDVRTLPPETARRAQQFRRYVERPFGEIIFARAVVFCDGPTERYVLPVLLSSYFDCNPAGLGVSFVDCESMNQIHTRTIIKAVHDLALPWFVFADNDEAGEFALRNIPHPATEEPLSPESDEVIMSGRKQIEQLLIDAKYQDEIAAVAKEHDIELGDRSPLLSFLKGNKPWAAELVAIRAIDAGKPLPESVVSLAERIEARLGTGDDAT